MQHYRVSLGSGTPGYRPLEFSSLPYPYSLVILVFPRDTLLNDILTYEEQYMCKYDALSHPCDQPGSKTLSKPVLLKNKEESRLDVSRRVRKGVGFKRECDAASVETVKLPSDEELALEKQDFNLFTVMS